jgi:hypothetical protein
MKTFTCEICGYPNLERPPRDETGAPSFEICPCCGGEFGYNDITVEVKRDYLRKWIKSGTKWLNPSFKPQNWSLSSQLGAIGVNLDEI